jgi:hypothetical protein
MDMEGEIIVLVLFFDCNLIFLPLVYFLNFDVAIRAHPLIIFRMVTRTAGRPIASNQVTARQAIAFLASQLLLGS